MRIRRKINLAFMAVFVLIMVILAGIVISYSYKQTKDQTHSYLDSSNRARAEHIRTFLQDQKEASVVLAASQIYRDYLSDTLGSQTYIKNKEKIQQSTARTAMLNPNVYEVFILNAQGKIVASSNATHVGADKSGDLYFTEAKKEVYIKDVYYSDTIKKITYTVSAPINDDTTGKFLGVSVVRYSPEKFYDVVKSENGLGDTEENFLINSSKYFLTPSRFLGEEVILNRKIETRDSVDCFSGTEVDYVKDHGYSGLDAYLGTSQILQSADYRGVNTVGTHSYIPETDWCLITKVDKTAIYRPATNLLIFLVFIFLLATVAFLFTSYSVAKRITDPLITLINGAKTMEGGDFSVRVAQEGDDEISELSRAFQEMTESIISSREAVDKQVARQTTEIINKSKALEDQQAAVLNILEDIEEEKENAVSVAADLEKFKLAVDNASDHVVITDTEGVVLYANKAVEAITGFPNKEVIGEKAGSKNLWGGNMSPDVYRSFWKTIKTDKKPFLGTFNNTRKDGQPYEAEAHVAPVTDERGVLRYFVGIERDITKEQEVDRAKTEFVSLASHQLRTPLSAINWYAEMLINGDAGKVNEEQRSYLEEIYKGNQRMVDLVNALLNVSRLELGTFEIKPEMASLCEFAKDVADELKGQIQLKKQDVKIICPPKTKRAKVDKRLMRIIFQNLLSNAVKYTPNGGKITVRVGSSGGGHIIQISDTGYGIPKSQHDRIFSKLFRADNVRAMDTEGTGLGLYIIKSILDSSGGSISFKSAANKGTTFIVKLPKTGMKEKTGSKQLD